MRTGVDRRTSCDDTFTAGLFAAAAMVETRREGSSAKVVLRKSLLLYFLLFFASSIVALKLSSHLYLRRLKERAHSHLSRVRERNSRLTVEKAKLKEDVASLEASEQRNSTDYGLSLQASEATKKMQEIFREQSLHAEVLIVKEELLRAKEKELVALRARKSERASLETEMAVYINELALRLYNMGLALPRGLSRRPYFSLPARSSQRDDSADFSFMQTARSKRTAYNIDPKEETAYANMQEAMLRGSNASSGLALLSSKSRH